MESDKIMRTSRGAPLAEADVNVHAPRSNRRGGQKNRARRLRKQEMHSADRWLTLVQGALRSARATSRARVAESWTRLQDARKKIRRGLWLFWNFRSITIDDINCKIGDSGFRKTTGFPVGFETLAPLSLRDMWLWRRAFALAVHVPKSRACSRHVLDWLRVPSDSGPHWLHQHRVHFDLDPDNAYVKELYDDWAESNYSSDDSCSDGDSGDDYGDASLPARLRPDAAEMARRAARYPLPV